MLTRMRAINFKSWKDSGDIKIAPLTAFFGTNSSGKTSLLQMLLLLKQTAESRDPNLILKTRWEHDDYLNLGTLPELIHHGENRMKFDISWRLTKPIPLPEPSGVQPIRSLTFETEIVADTEQKRNYVSSLAYYADNSFAAKLTRNPKESYAVNVQVNGEEFSRPQGRPRVRFSPPIKCYGFSSEAVLYYLNGSTLNELSYSFEQLFSNIYHLGPLREYPQRSYSWAGEEPADVGLRGERAVHALLAQGKRRPYKTSSSITLERRIAKWLAEMRLVASFRTEQISDKSPDYRVLVKRSLTAAEVPITDVGFGISQVLPVLVLCYYAPRGATIILEQPEIHLHPAVQSILADVFVDVVERRDIQLIIESHSEHLLRRLQRRIAEGELSPDKTALYFCESNESGSRLEALDVDIFGNIRNWPKDFFGDLTGDVLGILEAELKRKIEAEES